MEIKSLLRKSIKTPVMSDDSLNPRLDYIDSPEVGVKFVE